MKLKILTICVATLVTSTACFNGSSSSSGNNPKKTLENISQQNADNEATDINDAAKLQNDLSSLFGVADAEPVAVEEGDSVQDVIDRASN